MIDILLDPHSKAFAIALGLVVAIALLEFLSALIGVSASAAIDSFLPDLEMDSAVEFNASLGGGGALDGDTLNIPDAPGPGPLSAVLGWLCVGKVPILILLILFLSTFGVTGIGLQWLLAANFGATLPGWLISIPALGAALPLTRVTGLGFARLMPKEQTEAISQKEFTGKMASIIRGQSRQGQPAEAKITDSYGRTHYLLVEPDSADEIFGTEDELIIVGRRNGIFRIVRNVNPAMKPD